MFWNTSDNKENDYYNTRAVVETKLYNDNNCTRIIEEIEYNHIPHIN